MGKKKIVKKGKNPHKNKPTSKKYRLQEFKRGFGVPTLLAVHRENDPEGIGWEIAKAYCCGTGGDKAGMITRSEAFFDSIEQVLQQLGDIFAVSAEFGQAPNDQRSISCNVRPDQASLPVTERRWPIAWFTEVRWVVAIIISA